MLANGVGSGESRLARAIVSSSRWEIRLSAACHASSLVSLTITCRRMPKRTGDHAGRLSLAPELFSLPGPAVLPGKIKIDLLSGQLLRYLRRAAEIERWTRLLQWRKQQFGVANALMLAVKGDGFSLHQLAPDVGKFSRGLIALGVVEEDAVACQFGRIAAGDQIEQRPAV